MKKIVLFSFLLFSTIVFSQGEANNWFFGQNAGLNFNSSTPTPISGSLNTYEGCASFSDTNGNLLFYTDGTTVWDKNNNPMPNGNGTLKGDPSSSQSAIVVPHPGNSNLFYIFTVGANDYNNQGELINPTEGLHCYTVDITANGGLGDVIGKSIDLSDGKNAQWTEKVTSVKGADCNTFWVISLVNNTYYSYKIDDVIGLNTTPIISPVTYFANDTRGYLKVSPDGKKLASATYGQNSRLILYSFDDSTGKVANDGQTLLSNSNYFNQAYGVEFSPLSTKLYCSTATYNGTSQNYTYNLFQFDLNNSNIASSKTLIHSQVGYRGALQLAPNGKIYATIPVSYDIGTQYLDAINAPDELGTACDFQTNAINLSPKKAMQGLPPFIASLLLPIEITDNTSSQNINKTTVKRCIGENYSVTAQNISGNPTYKWTFNGSPIGSNNASLTLNNLTATDAGLYALTVETTDDCGFPTTYKGEITLEVFTPPNAIIATDINQCDDNNDGFFNFNLHTLKDTEILNGQNPAEFEVLYFTNQTDADNGNIANAVQGNYTNSSAYSSDTIFARIQNINGTNCYETTSFTITVFESPNPPTTILNYTVCDSNITGTDTDGIETFDLTTKTSEILNNQSPTNYNVTYYLDAALASPILTPNTFSNTSNPQTIYAEIVNNNNSSCSKIISFVIEVNALPTITDYFEFKQCDEDGLADGYTDFNLNEANPYLTNNNTSLNVTYYASSTDAKSGTGALNPFPFSNQTQSTVFARIENVNGCYRVAQVDLLVSSTHFPTSYLKTVITCDTDDTNDGISTFILADNDTDIIDQFPAGQNLSVSYYRNLNDVQLEQNEIDKNSPYSNEVPENQTIYVRIESQDNGACFGLGPHLQLVVNKRPEFELDTSAIYCQNLNPITISTFNEKGNYTYEWYNPNGNLISTSESVSISSEGIYTVYATSSDLCESFPKTIEIIPSIIATISPNDITVIDDTTNNSITINTTNLGIGDYEFSLDEISGVYQNEPVFTNVAPGIHTIYIQDKNNCGIAQMDVSVIGYPKFFTPNNDGINDTWKVLGVNEHFYANSNIYIYDRFGKLIAQIDPKSSGWDGIFNGRYLPATDYWFSVEIIDNNGSTKIRKGHFSLIRR
jgi:gliding motility-associated-like protein